MARFQQDLAIHGLCGTEVETSIREDDVAIYVTCPYCQDIVERGEIWNAGMPSDDEGWKLVAPEAVQHFKALLTRQGKQRLAIGALLILVLVAGAIGFGAGYVYAGRTWKATSDTSVDWQDLATRNARYLSVCQEAHAHCRALCDLPVGPVEWDRKR